MSRRYVTFRDKCAGARARARARDRTLLAPLKARDWAWDSFINDGQLFGRLRTSRTYASFVRGRARIIRSLRGAHDDDDDDRVKRQIGSVAPLILNCTTLSLFALAAERGNRAHAVIVEVAVVVVREKVSRPVIRVPRKLIIARAVVNAIMDLLFIKPPPFCWPHVIIMHVVPQLVSLLKLSLRFHFTFRVPASQLAKDFSESGSSLSNLFFFSQIFNFTFKLPARTETFPIRH